MLSEARQVVLVEFIRVLLRASPLTAFEMPDVLLVPRDHLFLPVYVLLELFYQILLTLDDALHGFQLLECLFGRVRVLRRYDVLLHLGDDVEQFLTG